MTFKESTNMVRDIGMAIIPGAVIESVLLMEDSQDDVKS